MGKVDEQILNLLQDSGPLTLDEIAEKLKMKPKTVFKSLRRLFEEGKTSSDVLTRRYALAEKV